MSNLTRRDVLKGAVAAGISVAALAAEANNKTPESATMINVPFEKKEKVRIGMVGLGGRGQGVLSDLMGIPNAEIVAICDVVPQRIKESNARLVKSGRPAAAEYTNGPKDFEKLCGRNDIDFVYTATPWDVHVPVMLAAMNAGKHCGSEVPVATTMEDCWKLVDTSEKTRRHCMIMENCCYGYNELMLLNMCRAGVLGRLTHGAGAYLHDLRSLLLADSGEGLWRRFPHMKHNGNLYPTHGLGPVCNYMGINRGDRFTTQVSMSSIEAGLTDYRNKTLKADDPKMKEVYINGDLNTSILKTEKGLTVLLQHCTTSPRPYSRINMIQGSNGVFEDYPARIYIEGMTKTEDDWEDLTQYKDKYEHELWKKTGDMARKLGGHGGMDFLMCYRLIECFNDGTPPDMDVYDAACWSAPWPLSEVSVRKDGAPQKFPDFTRGKYKVRNGVSGI